MRVLLVDDEYLELEQLKCLIHERYPAWAIDTAEDAAIAKRLLQEDTYDLALIDIHIPGENGLVLCEYIKEHYVTKCIMVTAFQEFEYARESIRLQVMDYIVKPVIANDLYKTLDQFAGIACSVHSPDIKQVLEIIHEHYNRKLTLNDLAEQVHVTPTYLSRKFKEEIGENFQEYIVAYRIKKAKEIMKAEPQLSMLIVAERTGFSSQSHFSFAFKRITKLSPKTYKEHPENV